MIRAIIELFSQGLATYRHNRKIRKAEAEREAIREKLEKSRKSLYAAREENREQSQQYKEMCDAHKELKALYSKSVDDYMALYLRSIRRDVPPNPYDSEPPISPNPYEQEEVSSAVLWLTRSMPNHVIRKDSNTRERLVSAIVSSAAQYAIPPLLLTAIIYRESSFRPGIVADSKLKEAGLTQVHGRAARGCDLESIEGQVACGASWLREKTNVCGSLEGGLVAYGTAGQCKSSSPQVGIYVRRRMRLWNQLKQGQFNAPRFAKNDIRYGGRPKGVNQ